MLPEGAYTADRAAALSGVPKSTVHAWAREGVLVPSVSPTRTRLWSYADLLGLRTIYWLRQRKTSARGHDIPPTSMAAVRRALRELAHLDLTLWREDGDCSVAVDPTGHIAVRDGAELLRPTGHASAHQLAAPQWVDLIAPFTSAEGACGPDLRRPRPHLRIVPARLGGAPHVAGTRLDTQGIAALSERGMPPATIAQLYPSVDMASVEDAIDLEAQLRGNLRDAA